MQAMMKAAIARNTALPPKKSCKFINSSCELRPHGAVIPIWPLSRARASPSRRIRPARRRSCRPSRPTARTAIAATYTPFGGVQISTGPHPTAHFPGQWFQTESGLHQNWMRDYDPTTGRYLEADPLGLVDGASVYGYAGQNPMMNMDPTGQCFGPAIAWAPVCAGVAWGAVSVYIGWLLDPCYTWQEATRDFTFGFAFGGLGAAWSAGAGGAAAAGLGAASRGVGANKAAGDAFRDYFADLLRQAGRNIRTEVPVKTPFGTRVHDIEVRIGDRLVGYVETKLGSSRYSPSQRAKDFWIDVVLGVKTVVVRGP
ncbi:RHS repeat-associated core domain-containing protein [Tabrizicola sp.]|uniref:RHS repeat-associated core domain-containing protein n=1 Tax=Tabrizicola sp. TaxID=2005166 RepID=UPI00286AA4A9|nr:RHS repeat-associated core domain-containing protein [Tabrizicola sp.]